jgi:hypothetical protein
LFFSGASLARRSNCPPAAPLKNKRTVVGRGGRIPPLSTSPQISLTPCFSGVLRAERAKVNRFNGFRAAVSATLDQAAMRPVAVLSYKQN